MRNFYRVVAAVALIIVLLLAAVFFFLEKEKHLTFFYAVEREGKSASQVQVDYYRTEDKIIYKSTELSPGSIDYQIKREKLIFDKASSRFTKYFVEEKNFAAVTNTITIKKLNGFFEFLTEFNSKFGFVSRIPCDKEVLFFDRNSVLTYLPIIQRYHFARGGAQSFNVIENFETHLPPVKDEILIKNIKDEYINILGKKTRSDHLRVTSKILPVYEVWVAKKDKSILKVESATGQFTITRIPYSERITVKKFKREKSAYSSQEVLFPSGDTALSGTLDIPEKEGALPAVLLIVGEGAHNRDNAGMYADLGTFLAESGYVTLRYDKRGIGKSQGDNMTVAFSDELGDMGAALKYLTNHDKTDKEKIFIIAHSESCSYIPSIKKETLPLRGVVLLSMKKPNPLIDFESEYLKSKLDRVKEIKPLYEKSLDMYKKDTNAAALSTKKDFAFINGSRVFIKRTRELSEFVLLEGFETFGISTLIVAGKKDKLISPAYIKGIERTLDKMELKLHSVVYFRGLGHFLGELVCTKDTKERYSINREVAETVKGWIDLKSR